MKAQTYVLCLLVLCWLGVGPPCLPADYLTLPEPPPSIFPTPREAEYGEPDLDLTAPGGPQAAIVLPAGASATVQAAAEDLAFAVARLAPQAAPLPILDLDTALQREAEGIRTLILIGAVRAHPALDQALAAEGLSLSPTDPGPQGYQIAVREDGSRHLVLLAGCDDQGAYWAATSFAQLVHPEAHGVVQARRARVRDWPGFARRMTAVEAVYESQQHGLQSMQDRMRVVLGLKLNVSCYSGDNPQLNDWLRPRGFRAGTGYWAFQHVSRTAIELGLKPFNWGDERVLQAWEQQYSNCASLRTGLVIWHDATDAGWFNKYLDKFWDQRDDGDRQAFPEEHPARADAQRFNRIYRAVKARSPDTDVYFTVPCYYDTPENDGLPRVQQFRDYLRTLGRLTPKDITWVLEDRGPLSVAAYQHYLEGRCINYRYPFASGDPTWGPNFTAAKAALGYSDSYWFCTGHYQHDLMTACGAEFMWNPHVPDDYAHLTEVLVPRACRLLYGDAWREMAEVLVNLNLDPGALQAIRQPDLARAAQVKVARAVELLEAAQTKCPATLPDGQEGIRRMLATTKSVAEWMGARVVLAEALGRCQRAETLAAFGQVERAREAMAETQALLQQVTEDDLARHSFLRADHEAAQDRLRKLNEALQVGAAEGELGVLPLDGPWQFRLDPADEGQAARWFARDLDRSDWATIAVPGFWEQSGLEGASPDYDGLAWYARAFRVPRSWQGRKVILQVGACDDEAWVYVNGQLVGEHLEKDHPGVAWEQTFEFDITGAVIWDGDNVLAIRVNDTHGAGGIWKSVLLRVEAPDRPAPGPGDVQIRTTEPTPPELPAPIPEPPPPAAPQTRGGVQPGWSHTLRIGEGEGALDVVLSLVGYGSDPESTAGRPLTDSELAYLSDNRVGRLAVTSFSVAGHQLVMQDRYPGLWPALSLNWDGYRWGYHSVDKVEVFTDAGWNAVRCTGRVHCADYARFESWLQYEYELGLRAARTDTISTAAAGDGVCQLFLGRERATLIPDHDTGFAPNRNGPPYGSTGVGCSVQGLRMALGPLPASFRSALVAPFADLPPRGLPLSYASDATLWVGPVEPAGYVAALAPTTGVFLALLAVTPAEANISQSDAQGYPGEELTLALTPTLVSEWPAGSRNTVERWFAVGVAPTAEDVIPMLESGRSQLR